MHILLTRENKGRSLDLRQALHVGRCLGRMFCIIKPLSTRPVSNHLLQLRERSRIVLSHPAEQPPGNHTSFTARSTPTSRVILRPRLIREMSSSDHGNPRRTLLTKVMEDTRSA